MRTRADIEQKIREVIAAKCQVPLATISLDTRLVEDLHIDSFGAVELMFEIEEAFNLTIPDSALPTVHAVRDIADYVSNLDGKPASVPAVTSPTPTSPSSSPAASDSPPTPP